MKTKTLQLAGLLAYFIFAASLAPVSAQTPSGKALKIPDGTIVRVVLTQPLSSGTNHQNDAVHAEVAEDFDPNLFH